MINKILKKTKNGQGSQRKLKGRLKIEFKETWLSVKPT